MLGAGLGLLDAAFNTEAALRRGIRFMAALHASWAIGATLGPALIGLVLVTAGSWRFGYAVAALAFVAFAVATYLVRGDLAAAPESEEAPIATRGARRVAVMGAALMFVYVGLELGAGQWTFTRLTADGALSDGLAGLAVFLYWSALAAGRIALAIFGTRVSAERLIDLSVAGAFASALAFWLLPHRSPRSSRCRASVFRSRCSCRCCCISSLDAWAALRRRMSSVTSSLRE